MSKPMMSVSDPALRRYLERYVRRRVPLADADDAIQAVLCAALEAHHARRPVPTEHEELRKWLTGIARNKIAALYGRTAREPSAFFAPSRDGSESAGDGSRGAGEATEIGAASPDLVEAASLVRWAERQAALREADRAGETLDWMARESDGEKLETIAAEAKLPAARVRQRVSRLRRWMKERWVAELAVLGGALVALTAWFLSRRPADSHAKRVAPAPSMSVGIPETATVLILTLSPSDHALDVRRRALGDCHNARYVECLRALDDAARLDPLGDAEPSIVEARKQAIDALSPKPPPKPIPSTDKPLTTPIHHTTTGTPGGF